MACSSQPLPAEHATEVSGDSGDEIRFDAEILLEELHDDFGSDVSVEKAQEYSFLYASLSVHGRSFQISSPRA
jgi:hypothetical protein